MSSKNIGQPKESPSNARQTTLENAFFRKPRTEIVLESSIVSQSEKENAKAYRRAKTVGPSSPRIIYDLTSPEKPPPPATEPTPKRFEVFEDPTTSPFNPAAFSSPHITAKRDYSSWNSPARFNSGSASWNQASPVTPKPLGRSRLSRFKRNHSAASMLTLDDDTGPILKKHKSSGEDGLALLNQLKAAFEKSSPKKGPKSPLQRSKSEGFEDDIWKVFESDHLSSDDPFAELDLDGVDLDALDGPNTENWDVTTFSSRKKYSRYLVLETFEGFYQDDGQQLPEMVLRVVDDTTTIESYLHLRKQWFDDFPVESGDYIHVIGPTMLSIGHWVLDNEAGYLVVHPDTLVNSTQLGVAEDCLRRAVLEERVKKVGDKSPLAVVGQMIHEVVQTALKTNDYSATTLVKLMEEIIHERLQEIYFAGLIEEDCRQQIESVLPSLADWAKHYVGPEPVVALLPIHDREAVDDRPKSSIGTILDIEENVWSPTFGVKGKIDATTEIVRSKGNVKRLAVPLEVKTGKPGRRPAHITQTRIYTLMMSDKYDLPVKSGLLYYTKSGETFEVDTLRAEMIELVKLRNRFAAASLAPDLPDMIQRPRQCRTCFEQKSCFVFHKVMDKGDAQSSAVDDFEEATGHIGNKQAEFFKKWMDLIDDEEGDAARMRREVWTMTSQDREAVGRCFGDMELIGCESIRSKAEGRVSRYRYRFAKPPNTSSSMLTSQMGVGDAVVVSTEDHHVALAVGYILELAHTNVVVAVDHPIVGPPQRNYDFDLTNQTHASLLDRVNRQTLIVGNHDILTPMGEVQKKQRFRIDKDELKGGVGTLRFNLVSLLAKDGDEKGRRLIVDLEPPRFGSETALFEHMAPSLKCRINSLNPGQQQALIKSLQAMDYALILGMPGTGKTTLISTLIAVLVAKGKTVLLTSHTHTAVDNVLLKLKEDGIDFIRIGNLDRIHAGIQDHTPHAQQFTSVKQCQYYFESKPVVAMTCLSIGNGILTTRPKFDYCIVDEASQITLPACVGPLRYAETFILVGDHYQLPPVVRNPSAKDLSTSLFKTLSEAHPQSVVALEEQYRMNDDINYLANGLIYNGRLRCGNVAVANNRLILPKPQNLDLFHAQLSMCVGSCWLNDLLKPSRTVVFADTDACPALEVKPGDLVQNDVEALLVYQTTAALMSCGIEPVEIGIISPYRAQLRTISHLMQHGTEDTKGFGSLADLLEINTVDKYQGRDKDCIILSLVRSNSSGNVGDLLKDWRRLNVAMTRARKKVIVFGSKSTLMTNPLFQEFFGLLVDKQWIYSLPPNAQKCHRGFSRSHQQN